MEPLGIYVHVPFCVRKCAYCDFNAYSGLGYLAQPFVEAVCAEISEAPERGRLAPTVFVGGGTPTFLTDAQLARILGVIRETFEVPVNAEISAEANPSTVDASRFAAMRAAGFNRLSIGVQSFDDRLLRGVDRTHSAEEAIDAIKAARAAGFENLSLDLMFGLPGQSLADWEASLERAISLGTQHISTYALTLEPGTRFERLYAGGKLELPGEEAELAMYERAIQRLQAAGFEHYEVSNFARPGFQARHNLVYWRNDEYRSFGPGATSYVAGRRWTNEKHPSAYLAKVQAGDEIAVESERLEPLASLAETLMQGLRLREGVELARLRARYGIDPLAAFATHLAKLGQRGLVEQTPDRLRLTHAGLLLANDVFLELLP